MSNKDYAHIDGTETFPYRNDFQRGYENQFQNATDPVRPTSPGVLRHVQLKWWCWELVAAAISIALFAAVIVVLKVFDGKPLPQLPGDITLNTTVSLIAAVSKTALLLVASAFMSQFKWLWIHKRSRKLQELQAFDEASRGPWGALTLLPHSRISLASLGAILTLLTLGFDPFIQQLITTPQRDLSFEAGTTAVHKASVFDQSVLLAAAGAVNNTLLRMNGENPFSKIEMVVSNGISSQGQISDFSPSCPTANCTWPSFRSVGLCSTCMNVTNYARNNWKCEDGPNSIVDGFTSRNRTCTYNLPNSAFDYQYLIVSLDNGNQSYVEVAGEMRLNIWTKSTQQTTFSNNTFLLVSRVALENTVDLVPGTAREQVFEATECALAMCIEEHDLSVRTGLVNHTVTSTQQPFSMVNDPSFKPLAPAYDIRSAKINNVTYSVDGNYTLPEVMYEINTAVIGNITAEYTTTSVPGSAIHYDGGIVPTSALATSFYAGLNFTQAIENMATAVSQYIRSLPSEQTTAAVIGRAHRLETYIHVKWNWLVFPVVLVVGGVALLVIAIIQTHQTGLEVWKSSSLPPWFHGPPNNGTGSGSRSFSGGFEKNERVNTLLEMEKAARQTLVSLARVDDRGEMAWKLLPLPPGAASGYV